MKRWPGAVVVVVLGFGLGALAAFLLNRSEAVGHVALAPVARAMPAAPSSPDTGASPRPRHASPPSTAPLARAPSALDAGTPADPALDPKSPRYDPIHTMKTLGLMGPDVWRREPRDDAWAREFESKLESQLATDVPKVAPGAKVRDVYCHTASCLVRIDAPDDEAQALMGVWPVPTMADMGTVGIPVADEAHHVTHLEYVLMFSPAHRASNVYDAWYEAARRSAMARMAAARRKRGQGGRP